MKRLMLVVVSSLMAGYIFLMPKVLADVDVFSEADVVEFLNRPTVTQHPTPHDVPH